MNGISHNRNQMRYLHVASGRWNLSTWCSVNNLRLAVSLSISGFLSLAGSIADKKQKNKTAITVKLRKENNPSDTAAVCQRWRTVGARVQPVLTLCQPFIGYFLLFIK